MREDADRLGASPFRAQRTYDENLRPSEETELDWKVVSLRSPGGDPERTDPGGPGVEDYADTPWCDKAPYLASLFRRLPTQVRTARLMALGPGAEVDEHRDFPSGLQAGWVRLHVPILTNPGAVLTLDGQQERWQPGSLWYGDFSRPHSVRNAGDTRRVHLVIDCYVSHELLQLFPASFTDTVDWTEVLFDRPVVPLGPAAAERVNIDFDLPDAFLWGEREDLATPGTPSRAARLRLEDGDLIMRADGKPVGRLVHLGEGDFRLAGWTTERSIHLDLARGPGSITFLMREGSSIDTTSRPTRPGV
ncbi:aspartyl/asparaginyl beta-hydroxylase domain-containing protein [Kineosporia mesophila]|nr:aspartyl/asparaginyl beta-hydroxylase domain-containing protein [Kineosporia mesophila]MCD5352127.1 aspartyl/asparaginyl beta-hydroxylase domain-containing protein [Kineosporia mesophila]